MHQLIRLTRAIFVLLPSSTTPTPFSTIDHDPAHTHVPPHDAQAQRRPDARFALDAAVLGAAHVGTQDSDGQWRSSQFTSSRAHQLSLVVSSRCSPLRSLHASASFDDSSTPSNSDTLVPPVPPQPTFSEEVVRAEKAPAPIPLPQKMTTTHTTTTERTTVTHTSECMHGWGVQVGAERIGWFEPGLAQLTCMLDADHDPVMCCS